MSQETQKERLIRIMGTFDLATGHADTFDELLDSFESELRDVLGYYRQQRTWVGLTGDDWKQITRKANYHWEMTTSEYAERIGELTEARLKELNT
jgi:hypothetical protein